MDDLTVRYRKVMAVLWVVIAAALIGLTSINPIGVLVGCLVLFLISCGV